MMNTKKNIPDRIKIVIKEFVKKKRRMLQNLCGL